MDIGTCQVAIVTGLAVVVMMVVVMLLVMFMVVLFMIDIRLFEGFCYGDSQMNRVVFVTENETMIELLLFWFICNSSHDPVK